MLKNHYCIADKNGGQFSYKECGKIEVELQNIVEDLITYSNPDGFIIIDDMTLNCQQIEQLIYQPQFQTSIISALTIAQAGEFETLLNYSKIVLHLHSQLNPSFSYYSKNQGTLFQKVCQPERSFRNYRSTAINSTHSSHITRANTH